MKLKLELKKSIFCLFIVSQYPCCSTTNDEGYLAEMYINECVRETWYILEGDNPSPKYPYVVVSMCHALPAYNKYVYHVDFVEVKQIARFSTHAFLLKFINIKTPKQVRIWQSIYERLFITSIQQANFLIKSQTYHKDYPHYRAEDFKDELLRSRWNIDHIILYESHSAYERLIYQHLEGHLPYSIEKTMHRDKNISNLVPHTLFYRVISGRGHKCKHGSIWKQLQSLTLNYNAYDRIFCDAFQYYNLHFQGYWNDQDMYYLRGRLIRDEILSSFPPESSKTVYYASPMMTFVVLQRDAVTETFIFRPFPKSLWGLIVVSMGMLQISHYLAKRGSVKNVEEFDTKRFKNVIDFTSGMCRTVIVSAYGGMILLGILYPEYYWTPDTFSDLNGTTNYKICTSCYSPLKHTLLIERFKLNRILEENWVVRKMRYPAEYLAAAKKIGGISELAEFQERKNGSEKALFLAALAYDDKINLWIKGREFLHLTYSIFGKIKLAHDRVLSEIRYISLPSGATRMHFLLDAMKRGFTSGVWMRYHLLEMNYYKNVAPLIVKRIKRESNISGRFEIEESHRRSLTLNDLYLCFAINGIGLVAASSSGLIEMISCKS